MYNILIVDDEKIERSGIRMLLKRMGIELGVFEACNGKQALEYLTSDKNTGMGHIDILLPSGSRSARHQDAVYGRNRAY